MPDAASLTENYRSLGVTRDDVLAHVLAFFAQLPHAHTQRARFHPARIALEVDELFARISERPEKLASLRQDIANGDVPNLAHARYFMRAHATNALATFVDIRIDHTAVLLDMGKDIRSFTAAELCVCLRIPGIAMQTLFALAGFHSLATLSNGFSRDAATILDPPPARPRGTSRDLEQFASRSSGCR